MQLACLEYARNVIGLKDSNSEEIQSDAKTLLFTLIGKAANPQGLMQLGLNPIQFKSDSKISRIYNKTDILERHRHRYAFNQDYYGAFVSKEMDITGINPDTKVVESIELNSHPWFIGVQYHPEFLSRPLRAHPLFKDFINAALVYQNNIK